MRFGLISCIYANLAALEAVLRDVRAMSCDRVEGFTIVHAGLPAPAEWRYVFDRVAATEHLSHQTQSLCFSGHTLVTTAFISEAGNVRSGTFSRMSIMSDAKYLVTVGGAGECIPGYPGARYVIYDSREGWVESRCIDYPGPDSGCEGAGRPVRVGGPKRPLRSSEDLSA
jgi:hypothetical protein